MGGVIYVADPGTENARAMFCMPSDINKMFVHEDIGKDHSTDRYEQAMHCLGLKPTAETTGNFFGIMYHEDWGDVHGELFTTEIDARAKFKSLPFNKPRMLVGPPGEVYEDRGFKFVDNPGRRREEMLKWYSASCKGEQFISNAPYIVIQYIKQDEVQGWPFKTTQQAREKYKSLGIRHSCMIVDCFGAEIACYGVGGSGRKSSGLSVERSHSEMPGGGGAGDVREISAIIPDGQIGADIGDRSTSDSSTISFQLSSSYMDSSQYADMTYEEKLLLKTNGRRCPTGDKSNAFSSFCSNLVQRVHSDRKESGASSYRPNAKDAMCSWFAANKDDLLQTMEESGSETTAPSCSSTPTTISVVDEQTGQLSRTVWLDIK